MGNSGPPTPGVQWSTIYSVTVDDSLNVVDNLGFATYFNHLLNTKTCVDVTFVLETQDGKVEVFAHQLVLAMRSAYFADKFYGNQRKKENQIIHLGKIDPKAFEDMIRFCYGCNSNMESIEEIRNLFILAYQFKVMSLTDLCRSCLRDIEIVPRNVLSILDTAEYMEEKKLINMCSKIIEEKTRDVMGSCDLREVTPTMVRAVISLPKLFLNSEYELTKWLFEWAKVQSKEEDSGYGNTRQYLEIFLQNINFLALTSEEFAMLCKDYPDILSSEEIASISLNIAISGSRKMPGWYNKDMKFRECTEGELAKRVNKEIEDMRKGLANVTMEVVRFEEEFLFVTERRHYTAEIDEWWKTNILSNLFSVGCIYTEIGYFFETNKEKGKKLIEMIEMIKENDDEIETIKEIAEEIVVEIKEVIKEEKDLLIREIEKRKIDKILPFRNISEGFFFDLTLKEFITGIESNPDTFDRFFKKRVQEINCKVVEKIQKLNAQYNIFRNRIALLK